MSLLIVVERSRPVEFWNAIDSSRRQKSEEAIGGLFIARRATRNLTNELQAGGVRLLRSECPFSAAGSIVGRI